MRRLLAGMLVVTGVATGCSLPLPNGVQSARTGTAGQRQTGDIAVLPPGPRAGAAPVDVVQGFLGAQSSADGRHAVARAFLAPDLRDRWRDGDEVDVYDPASLVVQPLDLASAAAGDPASDRATVSVTATLNGLVHADGSYQARTSVARETYQLQRQRGGDWRLTDVPTGLRLTPADLNRSFRPALTYYLAPSTASSSVHLVPDQVFLPVSTDPAQALVRRLLAPPSRELAGSVRSAVPAGTGVRSLWVNTSGVVDLDLSAPAASLDVRGRQELSAQLVWTLRTLGPTFTGLRLRVEGQPLKVSGEGELQDSGEWDGYDPDGLAAAPPVFYVVAHRLRVLGGSGLPAGPATAGEVGDGQAVAIDQVVVTPDRSRLALLSRGPSGTVTVRTGTLHSTSYPVVLTAKGLSSPSWGSGDRGLWLLRDGNQVVVVGPRGPRPVGVADAPRGRWTSLAVARDGVRVALVAGGRLFVGRVDNSSGSSRLFGFHQVAPHVAAITTVAWETATSLVALGRLQQSFLPVRVAVDGSSATPLDGPGLPGRPTAVTASPAGVVVTAVAPDGASRLYQANGTGFTMGSQGTAPAYPG